MRQLTSIVARNTDGVIGVANRLPWRVKSDLGFFKRSTLDNVIIMGRKTHDSLGGCLPKRRNIVVTHEFSLISEGPHCESASDIGEALYMADAAAGKTKEIFVVGGASMYEQFAPFVDRYLITQIAKSVDGGDTFFNMSMLGNPDEWTSRLIEEGSIDAEKGDEANFQIYEYISKDRVGIAARRHELIQKLKDRSSRRLHGWKTTAGMWA